VRPSLLPGGGLDSEGGLGLVLLQLYLPSLPPLRHLQFCLPDVDNNGGRGEAATQDVMA